MLIVGWDGATSNMIDPLLRAGRLPTLAGMIERGARYELESTFIPISSAAWTAAVTGVGPAAASIFSFFKPVENSYNIRLISARDRAAPPIWRRLEQAGLRTHVIGLPVTYPPEEISGLMFGCMLSPPEADYAHPRGLTAALRSLGFVPDLGSWRESTAAGAAEIERQHDLKTAIVTTVLRESAWDLSIVVYKSLDVLSHSSYTGRIDDPVGRHYAQLDDALAGILAAAGDDCDVLLMSDHGFGLFHRLLSVNGALVELGLAAVRDEDAAAAAPPEADGGLAEAVPSVNAEEMRRLDLTRTRVFCDSTEGRYAALRLNLAGRMPLGTVPIDERDAAAGEVIERLLTLRDRTGSAVFTRAWRMRELYVGEHLDELPEVVVEGAPDVLCKPWYRKRYLAPLPKAFPEHELQGVLIAAGPSIARRRERGAASILDVTPTALALLGQPIPRELHGRVIDELFRDPPNVGRVDAAPLPGWVGSGAAHDAAESERVIRGLRALGYLGDAPEPSPAKAP